MGEEGARRYLLRDIVVLVVARDFKKSKRGRKMLTKRPRNHHRIGMQNGYLSEAARERLKSLSEQLGGVEALARKMDIPARTLRNAIDGRHLRQGTVVLIEKKLEEFS
jgi:hypothetical protein